MIFQASSQCLEVSSDLFIIIPIIFKNIKSINQSRFDTSKAFSGRLLAGLHELRDVLDLILPILEGEMDVIAHLLDDCLHGCGLADDFYLLSS